MSVFFVLPIQSAIVKVFILDQMQLSIAGVSVGSYVIAFVLRHSLFGQFAYMFLVGTVFMIVFYLLPLILLLPFRWLVSSLFLLFR